MNIEALKKLNDKQFRRQLGVKRKTFEKIVAVSQEAYDKHKAAAKGPGGRPPKLTIELRVLMTLEYLREYRTYFHVSKSYGISEGYAYKTIRWVEDTLIKSKMFSLPGRKALLKNDVEYELVLVDASEHPIQRPKKNKKRFYLGKKKRHTLKSQIVVDKKSKAIMS